MNETDLETQEVLNILRTHSCLMNRMQAKITASGWVVIESVVKFKILGMTLINSS
jgi:hypothetical protein